MSEKLSTTLPGTVDKIIKSPYRGEPEKAQIHVQGAEHLYRELRIDNKMTNEDGDEVSLKQGAHVEVKIEADAKDAISTSDHVTAKGQVRQTLAADIRTLGSRQG